MIGKILHIGIPGGIENSIFQLGRVLVVSIIALFGTTQIAANAVANNLDGMGVLPGQAMNLAMITVIGRCVGAGDFEQAEYYTKKMMKLTYLISGLCCLGVIITMPLTMKLYGLSEETLKLAAVLVLSMVIMRLGVGYLLAVGLGLGAVGVWCAMILDWVVRVICFVGRYRSGKWKNFYHGV